jgi:hypothetical protein
VSGVRGLVGPIGAGIGSSVSPAPHEREDVIYRPLDTVLVRVGGPGHG